MEWFSLEGIPWWGLLIALVATFVFGAVWYSPPVLFRPWQRAAGFTDAEMKQVSMGSAYSGMVAGNVVGLIALAILLVALDVSGWAAGALTGAVLGAMFRWGAHLVHNGFALRKPLVSLIDGAHDTIALAIAGAIMGAFL